MMSRIRRFVALLFAMFALLGLAVGCSDDDDAGGDAAGSSSAAEDDDGGEASTGSGAAAETTTTTAAPRPGDEIGDDLTAQRQSYCEVWSRLVFSSRQPFNEDNQAEVRRHYNALIPLAEELEAKAPDEIKPKVQELLGYLRDIAGAGSEDAVDGDANSENGKTLKNYAERVCDAPAG